MWLSPRNQLKLSFSRTEPDCVRVLQKPTRVVMKIWEIPSEYRWVKQSPCSALQGFWRVFTVTQMYVNTWEAEAGTTVEWEINYESGYIIQNNHGFKTLIKYLPYTKKLLKTGLEQKWKCIVKKQLHQYKLYVQFKIHGPWATYETVALSVLPQSRSHLMWSKTGTGSGSVLSRRPLWGVYSHLMGGGAGVACEMSKRS